MKKILISLLFIVNAFFLNACSSHYGYYPYGNYGGYGYGNYGYYRGYVPPRAVVRPPVREPFYYGGKPRGHYYPVRPAQNYSEALFRQQQMQNRINRRNHYYRHHH